MYISLSIQNDFIKTLSLKVLSDLGSDLQQSSFLYILVDETTDVLNREQATVVIRWINNDMQINEEFIGLYKILSVHSGI